MNGKGKNAPSFLLDYLDPNECPSMTDEHNWYMDAYIALSACRADPSQPISLSEIKAYTDAEGYPARLKHVVEMIQALDNETRQHFSEQANQPTQTR